MSERSDPSNKPSRSSARFADISAPLAGIIACAIGSVLILALLQWLTGGKAGPYIEFFIGSACLTIAIQQTYAASRPRLGGLDQAATLPDTEDPWEQSSRRLRYFRVWLVLALTLTGAQLCAMASLKLTALGSVVSVARDATAIATVWHQLNPPWALLVAPYQGLTLFIFAGMIRSLLKVYRFLGPSQWHWAILWIVVVHTVLVFIGHSTDWPEILNLDLRVIFAGYGLMTILSLAHTSYQAGNTPRWVSSNLDLSPNFLGFFIVTLMPPLSIGIGDATLVTGEVLYDFAVGNAVNEFVFGNPIFGSDIIKDDPIPIPFLGDALAFLGLMIIIRALANRVFKGEDDTNLIFRRAYLIAALLLGTSSFSSFLNIPSFSIVGQWSFTFGIFVLGAAYLVVRQIEISDQAYLKSRDQLEMARNEERNRRIQHADEIQRNASVAAHEVANPVGGALRFLNSATMHRALSSRIDPKTQEDRVFLSERLAAQVEGLRGTLAFVQLIRETGSIQNVTTETLPLLPFLKNMTEQYALQVGAPNLVVVQERNSGQEKLAARFHPTLLTNVLRIILDNCRDAEVENRPLEVHIDFETRDQAVVLLNIADNGRGMSSIEQSQYSQPPQGDASRPGRGLGVYGARYFMQRMQGDLRLLKSLEGKGTQIQLELQLM